jgi:hypothetical protein
MCQHVCSLKKARYLVQLGKARGPAEDICVEGVQLAKNLALGHACPRICVYIYKRARASKYWRWRSAQMRSFSLGMRRLDSKLTPRAQKEELTCEHLSVEVVGQMETYLLISGARCGRWDQLDAYIEGHVMKAFTLQRRIGSSPTQHAPAGAAKRHHQPPPTPAYPATLPPASTRTPRPPTHSRRSPEPRTPPSHHHGRRGSAPAAATPLLRTARRRKVRGIRRMTRV